MNLIFSIMGLFGRLLCCTGDILFDLKGKGNKKLGTSKNIDSNWSKMSEWRFGVSIICAMIGIILTGFGFYAIADMIRENDLVLSNIILITGFIGCIGGLFVITTKRPERIKECVPSDWDDGWENVHISVSIENQEMADMRAKELLASPVKHRKVFCSPLIGPITLGKYLDTGLIKCINVGGEMTLIKDVRPLRYEWVEDLYKEAHDRNIEFYFHQTGSMFIKDGKNIGKWDLKEQIKLAEEIQHELERKYREL